MANLNSATLAFPVSSGSQDNLRLSSVANISKGDLIAIVGPDGLVKEAVSVKAMPIAGTDFVRVTRGVAGTRATSHQMGCTVYTGTPSYFESRDPHGIPQGFPRANPWINLKNGNVWFAIGDSVGTNVGGKYWQLQTPNYQRGALGINTPFELPPSPVATT